MSNAASAQYYQRAANGGLDPSWLDLAFFGAPRFSVQRSPKYLFLKGFGTSGRKIGAPQKRQSQPRRIQPPICGPLILHFRRRKFIFESLDFRPPKWKIFPRISVERGQHLGIQLSSESALNSTRYLWRLLAWGRNPVNSCEILPP